MDTQNWIGEYEFPIVKLLISPCIHSNTDARGVFITLPHHCSDYLSANLVAQSVISGS